MARRTLVSQASTPVVMDASAERRGRAVQPALTVRHYLNRIEQLAPLLNGLEARRVLVVLDEPAAKACGVEPMLLAALEGRLFLMFTRFSPYPTLPEVTEAVGVLKDSKADTIIAVGGGTAIDVAKLAALAAAQDTCKAESLTSPVHPATTTIIAVPTTSGTGADTTHFSALYLPDGKVSVAHPSMRPHVAIVDPQLTASMPPYLTACTGLDALCQAIESLWAVGSNDQSTRYAQRALRLSLEHLPVAVHKGTPQSRRGMAIAAHLAGRAIDISKTTACHAMSYELTGQHGVPHGHAVAMLLPALLRYNSQVTRADSCDPRGPGHTRQVIEGLCTALGAQTPEAAADRFTRLLGELGCATCLREANVAGVDVEALVGAVNAERSSNNPRRLNADVCREIFTSIL
jgi:alcohol dehydrogenase class IV